MVIHVVTDDPAGRTAGPARMVPPDRPGYLGPETSPPGPAYAVRLAADAKRRDRRPWVRRA